MFIYLLFEREKRERELEAETDRDRESQAGFAPSAQSLTQGLNPQTVRS